MFRRKPPPVSDSANQSGQQEIFTSDLSVNEFLLVQEAGFDPVGLVVGSSIYYIGYQMDNWNLNQEMATLTEAMYKARELALKDLKKEAKRLNADGVVGMRLEVTRHELGESMAEFVAIGTAIRSRSRQTYRNAHNQLFTSGLSGQDFWTLLRAGYRPVELVIGNCVYQVSSQNTGLKQIGQNVEMTNYTQAFYSARELAMGRMQTEAIRLEAQGIVDVQVEAHNHGWDAHVIEFFALGTAITPISGSSKVITPTSSVLLNDQ